MLLGCIDERLWFTTFYGTAWAAQKEIFPTHPTWGSSQGPDITWFRDRLFMFWKGKGNDERLWHTSFFGNAWADQAEVFSAHPNWGSSHRPAIAVHLPYTNSQFSSTDILRFVWKGRNTDTGIWQATLNIIEKNSPQLKLYKWSDQSLTASDRGTSDTPALACFNGKLYMAWKNKSSVQIFLSSLAPDSPA